MVIDMEYYDKDYLEHRAKGWAKKKHKYISRKWMDGRWVYFYRKGDPKSENAYSYQDTNKKFDPLNRAEGFDRVATNRWADKSDLDEYYKNRNKTMDKVKKYGGQIDIAAGINDGSPKNPVRDSMKANLVRGDKKKVARDAKYLRELKEESPKAKVGSAILRLKNAETLLKKKVKDIL
jgi:hypothetical protein